MPQQKRCGPSDDDSEFWPRQADPEFLNALSTQLELAESAVDCLDEGDSKQAMGLARKALLHPRDSNSALIELVNAKPPITCTSDAFRLAELLGIIQRGSVKASKSEAKRHIAALHQWVARCQEEIIPRDLARGRGVPAIVVLATGPPYDLATCQAAATIYLDARGLPSFIAPMNWAMADGRRIRLAIESRRAPGEPNDALERELDEWEKRYGELRKPAPGWEGHVPSEPIEDLHALLNWLETNEQGMLSMRDLGSHGPKPALDLGQQMLRNARRFLDHQGETDFPNCDTEVLQNVHAAERAIAILKRWVRGKIEGKNTTQPIGGQPSTKVKSTVHKLGIPRDNSEGQMEWLAKAMLLVRDHPERSDAAIANEVGKHRSTLSRRPEYKAAAGLARGNKADLVQGHITADSDSALRDVEAMAPAAGRPDDKADRGQPIAGSKYVREYCAECGEPMKVMPDKVGTNPVCKDCQS